MARVPHVFVVVLLAAFGCTGEEPEDTGDVDVYQAGMIAEGDGGVFQVELVSAEPAPPDVGDNTWTIRVLGGSASPVAGTSLVLSPFMPEHGHGTSPADWDGEPDPGDDSLFEVGPFDLFMPGQWRFTFFVTGPDEGTDEARFVFEIEG